jgi:hypothetical protein
VVAAPRTGIGFRDNLVAGHRIPRSAMPSPTRSVSLVPSIRVTPTIATRVGMRAKPNSGNQGTYHGFAMTATHGTESPPPQSRCSTFQRLSDSKNTSATKLRSKKTMVIQNCSLMFLAPQSVPGRRTSSLSIRPVVVSDASFWISIGGYIPGEYEAILERRDRLCFDRSKTGGRPNHS